jgi:hypothetical protein
VTAAQLLVRTNKIPSLINVEKLYLSSVISSAIMSLTPRNSYQTDEGEFPRRLSLCAEGASNDKLTADLS